MSTTTRMTQIQRSGDGLVARCSGCGLSLRQVDGFDPDIALGTLLQHHPASPDAVHRPAIPAGWRAASSSAA